MAVMFAGLSCGTLAGSKIKITETSHDFGNLVSGAVVEHEFRYRNEGSEDLLISNVMMPCGCTTVADWTMVVQPGESGSMKVVFDTHNFMGAQSKQAILSTNDPDAPTVTLSLQCELWEQVSVEPRVPLLMVPSGAKKPVSMTLTLTNLTDEPMALGEPKASEDFFKGQIVAKKPGEVYELTVETVLPFPRGGVIGEIRVPTSLSETPELRIRVMASELEAIVCEPNMVMLGAVGSDEDRQQVTVKVTNVTEEAVRMFEPTSDTASIKPTLREVEAGRGYEVTLDIGKDFRPAQHAFAYIRVKTSLEAYPTVVIPVGRKQADADAQAP